MHIKGGLVSDKSHIYRVLSIQFDVNPVIYELQFLAFVGKNNLNYDIPELYSKKIKKSGKELEKFFGKSPLFTHGDYVRYHSRYKINNDLSRVFFAVYENNHYSYFVQQRANSDLYRGMKEWVKEEYLRK